MTHGQDSKIRLKIEFTKSRSGDFNRILGLIRKTPSFKETSDGGTSLYSVEFDESDFDSAQAVLDLVRGWRSVVFYINGKLVPRFKASNAVWDKVYFEYLESRKEKNNRRPLEDRLKMLKKIRQSKSATDLLTGESDAQKGDKK